VIGGTVSALSLQVDQLQMSINAVQGEVDDRSARLRSDIGDADDRIGRLEMLLAGLEDIEADIEGTLSSPVAMEQPMPAPTFRAARPHTSGRVGP
ncbi:MAG: hypothetical protein WBA67_04650, partial [Jannaschia sp.]